MYLSDSVPFVANCVYFRVCVCVHIIRGDIEISIFVHRHLCLHGVNVQELKEGHCVTSFVSVEQFHTLLILLAVLRW